MGPRRISTIPLKNAAAHSTLAVVSKEAREELQQLQIANNSIQLEDIFMHLNDELQTHQLGITKLSAKYINPLQRDIMFRMPDKPEREATSFALKFRLQEECLCQKYNYHTLKNHIFRYIDELFVQWQEKFYHKLEKSLAKQLDIGLFERELDDEKAITRLGDVDLLVEVRERMQETVQAFWETHAKSTFLHSYSLEREVNDLMRSFDQLRDIVFKDNEAIGMLIEDYCILLQATQFSLMNKVFVNNYYVLLDETAQDVKNTLNSVQELEVRIMARREEIARHLEQVIEILGLFEGK